MPQIAQTNPAKPGTDEPIIKEPESPSNDPTFRSGSEDAEAEGFTNFGQGVLEQNSKKYPIEYADLKSDKLSLAEIHLLLSDVAPKDADITAVDDPESNPGTNDPGDGEGSGKVNPIGEVSDEGSALTQTKNNDGELVDVTLQVNSSLKRLERDFKFSHLTELALELSPSYLANPFKIADGTEGEVVVLKDDAGILKKYLTAEFLEKNSNFVLVGYDDDKKTITIKYDPKSKEELSSDSKVEILNGVEVYQTVADRFEEFDKVLGNFVSVTGEFPFFHGKPSVVDPKEAGLEASPDTVVIEDNKQKSWWKFVSENANDMTNHFGFVAKPITHNGKNYIVLEFDPEKVVDNVNQREFKLRQSTPGSESETQDVDGVNNSVGRVSNAFYGDLKYYLGDRLWWGPIHNLLPGAMPSGFGNVTDASSNSITYSGVSQENIDKLTKDPEKALSDYGIKVSNLGDGVVEISYDPSSKDSNLVSLKGPFNPLGFFETREVSKVVKDNYDKLMSDVHEQLTQGDLRGVPLFIFMHTHTNTGADYTDNPNVMMINDPKGDIYKFFQANPDVAKSYGFEVIKSDYKGESRIVLIYNPELLEQ